MYPQRANLRISKWQPAPRKRSARRFAPIFMDIFVCILGLLSSVLLHYIGDFYVSEILLITLFPILLFLRGKSLLRPLLGPIFLLLGVWFLGLVISDFYRQAELDNRLRGMALVVFFAVEIAAFLMLLPKNERAKMLFLTSYATGSIIMAKLQPTEISAGENRWKFGYATGTIMLVILISCYFYARRKYLPATLILAAIAGYNLLVDYRSAFLEIMVAAVLVVPIIPERIGKLRFLPRKRGLAQVILVTCMALGAGWSAGQILKYAANGGFLGEEAQEKNEVESRAGNLILGGRPEVFTGLRAFLDSPIIGHGSWPIDRKYIEMQADEAEERGNKVNDLLQTTNGLIPTHSHIIGAMVDAGILGGFFWAYLLWLVAKAIVQVAILRPPLAPIYCFLLVTQFWATLFSPFGSFERITEAFTLVVIIDLLEPKSASVVRSSFVRKRWKRSAWMRPALTPPLIGDRN